MGEKGGSEGLDGDQSDNKVVRKAWLDRAVVLNNR